MGELEKALAALAELQKKFDAAQSELDKFRTDAKAVAEGKVAALQKAFDEAAAKRDAAEATVKTLKDEAAKAPKLDELVTRKLAIIDSARILHGAAWLADGKTPTVDTSKSEREIMMAALIARIPDFKADGKSDDYIRARFDLAVEEQKKADASVDIYRNNMRDDRTVSTVGAGGLDASGAMQRTFDAAVAGNQAFYMNRWKGADIATKARADAKDCVMKGQPLEAGFVSPIFDGREIVARGVALVKQMVPMSMLDTYGRMQGIRRDADPATAFFQRQLLYLFTQPYEYVYAPIKYADLWPITYEVPTGAQTWGAHQFNDLGQADIVDDYADDAPNAELVGNELIGRFVPVRSEFTFSLQDIRRAMMANTPLEAMKSQVARRIIERKCDALACTGDYITSTNTEGPRKFRGLANQAAANTATATSKAAGSTQWLISGVPNATPNEVLNDIGLLYTTVLANTGGDIEIDSIRVGKNAWGYLNTTRLDNFNQTTVGDYVRTKLPWLKRIDYWPRLNAAGASGVERIMGAMLNPEYARLVISQEFEMLPPQPVNMSQKTPCHKRWGEPQVMQPKSLVYMDGTSS